MTALRHKTARGPSNASKAAARYLLKHPDATAKQLAAKFKIAITTVYRARWWIERPQP